MQLGRYEVLGEVGRGGAGVVHRARSPEGRVVAIKLLGAQATPETASLFEREKRLLATLGEAEGFVPILDSGVVGGRPFLVFPFLEGGTLRERMRGKTFDPEQAVALVGRLARALGRAHERGIVHRDVKPENILFAASGEPLVADLGLAKHFQPGVSRGSFSQTGMIAGTAGYMSPEQLEDSTRVGPAVDVFALGVILHECLAGERPFKGDGILGYTESLRRGAPPLRQVVADAPAWLEPVLARALAPRPVERYPDGAAFARALARPAASRRRLGALAGAVLVVVALGASGLALLSKAPPPPAAPASPPSPPPPPRPPARSPAQELADRAAAEVTRDPGAALEDATKAIELDPRLASAWGVRARAHLQQHELLGARTDAERALALDPENVPALATRALTAEEGMAREALDDARHAVARDPADALAWCALAQTRLIRASPADREQNLRAAISDMTKATELDDKLPFAWFMRGGIEAQAGDTTAALGSLDRALELDPSGVEIYQVRAQLRLRRADFPGALADTARLVELSPESQTAHELHAEALSATSDYHGAVGETTRVIEVAPRNAHAWRTRGMAHAALGELESAVADLTRALELEPDDAMSLISRGRAYLRLDDRTHAIRDYERVVARWPGSPLADAASEALAVLRAAR